MNPPTPPVRAPRPIVCIPHGTTDDVVAALDAEGYMVVRGKPSEFAVLQPGPAAAAEMLAMSALEALVQQFSGSKREEFAKALFRRMQSPSRGGQS